MTTEDVRNELETQTHSKCPAGNLGGALLFLRAPNTFKPLRNSSKTSNLRDVVGAGFGALAVTNFVYPRMDANSPAAAAADDHGWLSVEAKQAADSLPNSLTISA